VSLFPKARPPKDGRNGGGRRKREPKPLPPVRNVHVFVDSGRADVFGQPYCAREDCGQVQRARVHLVPETPDAAVEQDARRLGETV